MKINMYGTVPIDKLSTDSKQQNQVKLSTLGGEHKAQPSQNAQLSIMSKTAQQAFETLSQQDDVDLEKVKQMQQAIANGELQLDEDALINTLLDIHN
ncbi:flagellar biosynthesis anti-sigma factor FlgM [Aestuariibacter sp. A3R04]|uniref:flagellar biosynthesis anti-sigma factor FlgM n=1 Tax=Aestuariibacter sp. A3R04 TaxID=2841571 RepID=UPI001C080F60|nr:flagellar biosynthesis anti-sigma factor FlgM [Aestuariibacter sp. A3R04]MBU3023148.1 flagellar biosynthesis anti-sigma factor FlgM [Aestuariibacter sp. A3R04]